MAALVVLKFDRPQHRKWVRTVKESTDCNRAKIEEEAGRYTFRPNLGSASVVLYNNSPVNCVVE